jgi:hypothetical protein
MIRNEAKYIDPITFLNLRVDETALTHIPAHLLIRPPKHARPGGLIAVEGEQRAMLPILRVQRVESAHLLLTQLQHLHLSLAAESEERERARTAMLARMRPSFSLFGMTTMPCCTPHESRTCAGAAPCVFAMRTTSSSSSRSDGLPGDGWPKRTSAAAATYERHVHTYGRVRRDDDAVLLRVRAERFERKTRV